MSNILRPAGRPRRQLTLLDSSSIILGIVIGAGIYETTPLIAQSLPGAGMFMLFWLLGGLVSLAGALCYAELATTYPGEGGDYLYLGRACGARTGFLFAWMEFWVVQPANIGALAFIFARYWGQVVPSHAGTSGYLLSAGGPVLILTLINILGVRQGKYAQNLLTAVKVAGLAAVCLAGLLVSQRPATAAVGPVTGGTDPGIAMILVLFTYGGWRNISYVAAEVIDPTRNILRALVWGTLGITAIYLFVNLAYLHALGYAGAGASQSIARDVVTPLLGEAGGVLVSLLVCITCLGNINGMLFTNARIYYALGRDYRAYAWLGAWSARLDSPVPALILQAFTTLVLILAVGINQDAFARLVVFSAPVYWLFSLLAAVSIFILRRRDSDLPRAFRVPWYPFTPLLFCVVTLFLCYASVDYAVGHDYREAYWILFALIAGLIAFQAGRKTAPQAQRDSGSAGRG
ncbi:MAG: amino acid permease [Gammaproteobacteria bacterium]|nr:amino acid permease [Gammaproteobacteria bacterium]